MRSPTTSDAPKKNPHHHHHHGSAFAQVLFVVGVEAGGFLTSAMAWWQSHHRKTAHECRNQRLRAEGRTASRLLRAFQEVQGHKTGQLSRLGVALLAALAGMESAPTQTEESKEADPQGMPQERNSERIMEPTVDVPVPHEINVTETENVAPAPASARRRRTGKRGAPTPAVTYAEPSPVTECVTAAPTGTWAAPAPVIEYVASSPAAAYAEPSPVTECVTGSSYWHLGSTSSSDRVCGILTCRCLCSAYFCE